MKAPSVKDKKDIAEIAYEKAVDVIKKCSTPHGFNAAYPGYDALWARDSMIISLGASFEEKRFGATILKSIETLANYQSPRGQIPNAVDIFSKKRKPHIDYKSIDSTLWFLIGVIKYSKKSPSLKKKYSYHISKALEWLAYQDIGEDNMLEQLPTTDWQDAFPHKYGHTINTQALYYVVLNEFDKKKAKLLKEKTNNDKDDCLWDNLLGFYVPWRWKNHNQYKERGNWFDSLGNILAILSGLAEKEMAERILSYIDSKQINQPFPIKSIYPPIKEGDEEWEDYFKDCDARTPYHYLNAGIWTYIGGFYVLALLKVGQYQKAVYYLNKLAEANISDGRNFNEWLEGNTGNIPKTEGSKKEGNQGWNAGTYVLAYHSVKEKKSLF